MLQSKSRVKSGKTGLVFYEQDILYDDYIYSGSCQITVDLDYFNTGFGIMLINATNHVLTNNNSVLLFKMNHRSLEVILKENDMQKNIGTFSSAYARTITKNLKMVLNKNKNVYSVMIGDQTVCTYVGNYDFDNYFIGYYSNKDNIINNISVAASIPYNWIVNMRNTNGGYIDFHRDGFELIDCNGPAEIGQIEINLDKGEYFLKYESVDSDMVPYIFLHDDKRIVDEEKNILRKNGSFIMKKNDQVSLKFKGTKGRISKITITSSKENEYVRTTPDFENVATIDSSYITFNLSNIKSFEFDGNVKFVPGTDHYSPIEYTIFKDQEKSYGLYDLNIATNVFYHYDYHNGDLNIYNPNNINVGSFHIEGNTLDLFRNINGIIKNLVITNHQDEDKVITIENTIKKHVPAFVKSPIIVLDKDGLPFDLSSSYRYYYKNGEKHYWFTNTEREYFEPAYSIFLEDKPVNIEGSIIVYGIKKNSKWDLDRLLEIEKEGFDSLNACADSYDIFFEEDLRYLNKEIGEIRLQDISNYKYIVVDYLKDKSYCLNYRYALNSYEVDISVKPGEECSMIYDNIGYSLKDYRFVNEVRYVNTNKTPIYNGYIVIGTGGDN